MTKYELKVTVETKDEDTYIVEAPTEPIAWIRLQEEILRQIREDGIDFDLQDEHTITIQRLAISPPAPPDYTFDSDTPELYICIQDHVNVKSIAEGQVIQLIGISGFTLSIVLYNQAQILYYSLSNFVDYYFPVSEVEFEYELPSVRKGVIYEHELELKDGTGVPPFSFSLAAGGLPPGLTLDATGVISGTPTTIGTYYFQARVDDDIGQWSELWYKLEITE